MAAEKFQVTGIDGIKAALKQLPAALQKKVLRKAMREAMKTVKEAAKAEAPVDTGALRDAIKVKAGRGKKGVIVIDVRVGKKDFEGDQFYAAMVEYGTSNQTPNPYMRRAFDRTKDEAARQAIENVLKGVDQVVGELRSKGNT